MTNMKTNVRIQENKDDDVKIKWSFDFMISNLS